MGPLSRLTVACVLLSSIAFADSPTYLRRGGGGGTPTVGIANGGTTETASTEDAVLVGAGTTDWVAKVLVDCDAASSAVTYDTTTNAFGCNTIDGASAFEDLTGTAAIDQGGTGQTTQTAAFDALAPTTSAGDISYHNGTDNIRLAKGTADQVLTMNAGATAPEWADAAAGGGGTLFVDGGGRRIATWHQPDFSSSTLATIGMDGNAPQSIGSGGAYVASNTVFLTRPGYRMTTGAVSGDAAGKRANMFFWDYGPAVQVYVGTAATITSIRIWVGISKFGDSTETSDAPGGALYAMFRFSTGAGDTNWQACTGNGTASCTDTGTTVAGSTIYKLTIDYSTAGSVLFYINDVLKVTKTTNLPTGVSSSYGPWVSVTTLTTAARAIHISSVLASMNQ